VFSRFPVQNELKAIYTSPVRSSLIRHYLGEYQSHTIKAKPEPPNESANRRVSLESR